MENKQELASIQYSNLKIIETIRNLFHVSGKGRKVKLGIEPTAGHVIELLSEISKNIWTDKKILKALNFLQQPSHSDFQKVYYPGPSKPMVIDLFVNRISLLGYKIIIDDPLSELASAHPKAQESPYRKPDQWLSVIIPHALYLVSLEEYIKAGMVFLCPPIFFRNPDLLLKLADQNKKYIELLSKEELDDCSKYFMFEQIADTVMITNEMLGRWFNPKTYPDKFSNIKREDFANLTDEQRLNIALNVAARQTKIADISFREWYLERKRRRTFDYPIKKQLDITGHHGSMMQVHMGTISGSQLYASLFDCIPITDEPVSWCILNKVNKKLNQKLEKWDRVEKIKAYLELKFEFLNDVPFDFVTDVGSKGVSERLREVLFAKWQGIRDANEDKLEDAIIEYNQVMKSEYGDFKGKWEDIKRRAIREYGLAGVSGAGAIITGSIDSRLLWLPVAATVPLIKAISDTAYERSSLKRNPLYVFLKLNYGDKRF